MLSAISAWTDRLLDANLKTIAATKLRAEIRAKLAEEEAGRYFSELTAQLSRIIWSLAPDDAWIDAYEARLRRDIFGPLKLELPEQASS